MNKMAETLRQQIALGKFLPMPSCFDGLSVKMIEQAGFDLSFMSGFAASASRLGAPDLGLMSYGEVLDQARNVIEASSIPVIADGDTGYGNAMNVYRTVSGFARVGCAGVLIEDQLTPKRCGHTPGKDVSVARKPLTGFRRQLMPAARIPISSSWGVPMPITRMG